MLQSKENRDTTLTSSSLAQRERIAPVLSNAKHKEMPDYSHRGKQPSWRYPESSLTFMERRRASERDATRKTQTPLPNRGQDEVKTDRHVSNRKQRGQRRRLPRTVKVTPKPPVGSSPADPSERSWPAVRRPSPLGATHRGEPGEPHRRRCAGFGVCSESRACRAPPRGSPSAPRPPPAHLRAGWARLGWGPPPSSPRPGAAPPRTDLPRRQPPRCQRRGVRAAPRAPAAPIRAARRPTDPRRPTDGTPPAGRHPSSSPSSAAAPAPARAGLEPAARRALRGGGGGRGDRKRLRATGGNQRAGTRVWDLLAGRGQRSPAGQRQGRAPAAGVRADKAAERSYSLKPPSLPKNSVKQPFSALVSFAGKLERARSLSQSTGPKVEQQHGKKHRRGTFRRESMGATTQAHTGTLKAAPSRSAGASDPGPQPEIEAGNKVCRHTLRSWCYTVSGPMPQSWDCCHSSLWQH
ncbi:translation initiation factor IF-2-like [Cygnus olor]|uniref:translation initiation factor IF-2-like n=1 Tax=Cygnus olor TaxID=8869 RepID=UPI001ADEA08F|nr:translation initiation factor IF-2-like [Cygnus olor]